MPRRRLPNWTYGWLGVALCIVVLEAITRTDVIPGRHFPPPSATLRALVGQLDEPGFWLDLRGTLSGWGAGLSLAVAVAVPFGLAVGSSDLLYRLLRFPIDFVRSIPTVALLPIVVLVLGTGLKSKVFMVALAAFWPLLIQTIYGAQDADPVTTDTARAFRLSPADRVLRVTFPGALPYIATGIRLSSSVALTLAVTAELLLGSTGLGRSISLAGEGGNVARMYSLIAVAGVMGWALDAGWSRIAGRLLDWHGSARPAEATA